MIIKNIPKREKNSILSSLQNSIKKYGLEKVKSVTNHYFKNYKERMQAKQKIDELKKEIAKLEKKK